jgi:pimeloyl-ACP methyl ester carboxylesterase
MSDMQTRSDDGVVLLHAIARTPRSFQRMEARVKASGFQTLAPGYNSRGRSLETLADDIHADIEAFGNHVTGALHFVGHSMGGLLARAYIAKHRPERLGRVVMLGTPNGGSEIADRLKGYALYRAFFGPAGQQLGTQRDEVTERLFPAVNYPVGIIAGNRTLDPISSTLMLPSPNDGRVSVENTKLNGMADHIVVAASHTLLVRNVEAINQTISFLHHGRFAKS